MYNFNTDVGRIFCQYDKETDDFDKLRLIKVDTSNGHNDEKIYIMAELDDACHIKHLEDGSIDAKMLTQEQFTLLKHDYTALSSEGIMSITNIVAAENESHDIRDVLAIFFPNNRMTKVPDAAQPYIVARQGANNIFSMNCFGDVGLSLSLDSIPEGYTLTDLMENIRVIGSYLTHVYKTDNSTELDIILSNDTTTEILHDLFDHQYNFYKNTRRNFNEEVTDDSVLNGYCRTIKKFLESTDFMGDLFNKMNIIRVDFPMAYSTELDIDQRLMCSMLLGGAKIAKAVPLMFDYSINMTAIKMKYFLAEDSNDILWIVPYTESPAEVDPKVLYDLTEERTTTIQNRLAKVIRAYDQSAAKETLSKI